MKYIFNGLTLLVSIIAIVISIINWHKSRSVYGIEIELIRSGNKRKEEEELERLANKLKNGEYTILNVSKNINDLVYRIVLGRVKKK